MKRWAIASVVASLCLVWLGITHAQDDARSNHKLDVAQLSMSGTGEGGFGTGVGPSPISSPIVSTGGINIPSNSGVSFGIFHGGGSSQQWQAGLDNTFVGEPAAIAGTVNNLVVNFPTALSTGSYAITLNINGSATALTCTITSASTLCTDTTHNISVAAGDILMWTSTPTGTPTVQATAFVQVSAVFTGTSNNESQLFVCCSNGSTVAASFFPFGANESSQTPSSDANASIVMPTNGVISKLTVKTKATVTANYVLTLYKNGAATALTCTESSGQASCTDGTNSVSISAGDTISLQGCPGSTTGVGGSCTPSGGAAPATIRASARFVPTIQGETVLSYTSWTNLGVPATTGTNFFPPAGNFNGGNTTEATSLSIAPIAMTVKKLFVSQSTTPGGSATRTLTLRQGNGTQSSTSLTCTIASASTSCNDMAHTYSATLNNFLNLQSAVSATNATITAFSSAVVVTIP